MLSGSIMKMIASGLIASLLISAAFNRSTETRKEKLEYYQKIVGDFFKNVSTWQPPDNSHAFFNLEDGSAEPGEFLSQVKLYINI